jgi:adenylate cyclase
VVEGSVRKVGNRVRITAQLIDAATNTHVWADRYDRDLTNIFAVQDEVTREIVGALRRRIAPDDGPRCPAASTQQTVSVC